MIKEESKKSLLFFGDLPPNYLDGISISSQTNLELLQEKFQISVLEEENDFSKHTQFSLQKIRHLIRKYKSLINQFKNTRFDYFYLTYSLSTFGGIKTLIFVIIAKFFSQAKIILHIHRGDFYLSFYQSLINRITTSFVFNYVDKIIVLSQQQKLEYRKKNPLEKYCVLENTVSEEYTFESDTEVKKDNRKLFIYISNYLKAKGIFDLLDVFKELAEEHPDIHLITFGRFTDDTIRSQIQTYQSETVTINESISGVEKFKMMHRADGLILPSWNEGQPLTILEAISVKTPVIVSAVGLIPEMVGEDYPYLFEAKNKENLKEIIIQFANDPRIGELGEQLNQKYIKEFSRNSHQTKLFKIFS